MIDGNTVALNRYEQEQEHQEQALITVLDRVEPLLERLEALVGEIYDHADDIALYDFTEVLSEEIQERIS